MRDDLYERDILAWSREQAALLRALAAGAQPNQRPDYENIAEEIEAVGKSELNSVWSHLVQALVHIIKVKAWPSSIHAEKWRKEVEHHRSRARRRYAPSMAQNLDIQEIYRAARREAPDTMDGIPPVVPIPDRPPFSLDELRGEAALDL